MNLAQPNTKTYQEASPNTTNTSVIVNTTARLHMGFFDLHGGLGRQFGSIGLSIDAPNFTLRVEKSSAFSLTLPHTHLVDDAMVNRVKSITEAIVGHNHVAFVISALITPHAGLGSGTQFALGIGAAVNQLFGLGLTMPEIAQKTGRGRRSGIGIAAFEQGGLIIDGGRSLQLPHTIPPILARYDFPKTWSVLLIEDCAEAGIHGEAELNAFKTLPTFSENLAAHLCRHVLMQTMPAMMAEDLPTFGASIHALQAHVGDYFAPAQGGRYASKTVGEVLEYLLLNGAPCVGQSSWGPTGFAVFENVQIANEYLNVLKTRFTHTHLAWHLCKGNNIGADIRIS